jgi:hypothetical protein
MSGRQMAWTTAGATGVLSVVLAAITAWLFLTQPLTVATAAAGLYDAASQVIRLVP